MNEEIPVKILNFRKSYSDINVGEELIIYIYNDDGKIDKKELLVVSKDDMVIILKEQTTDIQIEFLYEDFIVNKYHILDIVREARFIADEDPEQIFRQTVENFVPKAINMERQYIQKAEYEKIYNIDEQMEDIYNFYTSRFENPSNFTYMLARKKAHTIGMLIDSYTGYRDTQDLLLHDLILDNKYVSPLIKPILSDTRLVYENDLMYEELDSRNQFVSSSGDNNFEIDQLSFLVAAYKNYELSNNRATMEKLNFRQLRNVEYGDGELATQQINITIGKQLIGNVGGLERQITPLNAYTLPVLDVDYSTYKFRANSSFDAYRYVSPTNKLTIPESKTRDKEELIYDVRRVLGPIYIMKDNPDDREIGQQSNIKVCHGTAKTAESKYHNPLDKDIPASNNNFNKMISKPPSEDIIVPGENVLLAGFVLHSPYFIAPSYNKLIRLEKRAKMTTVLKSTEGYWNVIDRVIQSKIRVPMKKDNIKEIRDLTSEAIDYRKNNFIYLSGAKNLTKEELAKTLKEIIPSPEIVFKIENEEIQKIDNITDLNKILSKYFLNMKNLNIHLVREVEDILNNRYVHLKENRDIEHIIKTYYTKLNNYIEQSFDKIYRTLFTIDITRNITVDDISTLLDKYLQMNNVETIRHILNFYFGIEAIFNSAEEARELFVQCFYDRYVDYLISDSPIRLLIRPNTEIPHTFSQKVVSALRKYYGFLNMTHRPTRIGIINEMYHLMFVKDSMENYNIFNDYVYAINNIQRLQQQEGYLKEIVGNKELYDKAKRNIEEQLLICGSIANNCALKLERFLDRQELYVEATFKSELAKFVEPTQKKRDNPAAAYYNEKFQLIMYIPDPDVQYSELDKFISDKGLLNRKLVDGVLEKVPVADSTWIYYDIPGEIVPMCCKHYLLLVKQAWKSNTVRVKLQELLNNHWGEIQPEARFIYCKNCGEIIDFAKESEMEGYGEDDKVIKLREAVYDFMEDEDDYTQYFNISGSSKNLVYVFLQSFMTSLQMKLNRQQVFEIVNDTSDEINRQLEDPFTFEANLLKATESPMPLLDIFYQATGPKIINTYKNLRNGLTNQSVLNEVTIQQIRNMKVSNSVGEKNRLAFLNIFDDLMVMYNAKKMFIVFTTLIAKLASVLISSDPEIKILGNVERTGRLRSLGNYLANPDATIANLMEICFVITRQINNKDSPQMKFNYYFKSGVPAKRKDIELDRMGVLLRDAVLKQFNIFSNTPIFKERVEQKQSVMGIEAKLITERIAYSSPWKTFRPILNIGRDVQEELDKIDLSKLETQIMSGSLTDIQAQYAAAQLSFYLFFSIQKILTDEQLTEVSFIDLKNNIKKYKFSNYCCLGSLRAKYIDYFISKDATIEKCIQLMANIQSKAFYNPNQQLFAIVGDTIQKKTPKLLDYIEEGRKNLNKPQLITRIKRLLTLYALLDGENGSRRIYSNYYDVYLAKLTHMTRDQIYDELRKNYPDWNDVDLQRRLDNLYSKEERGLIREDIDNEMYIWNIEDKIKELVIESNDANLLELYDSLVKKLYFASRLFINVRGFQRVDLKTKYDDLEKQVEKDKQKLQDIYNSIAFGLLEDSQDDARQIYRGFFSIVDKSKEGIFGKAAREEFNKEYAADFAKLKAFLPDLKLDNMAKCSYQEEEKIGGLSNQIRIENYREDELEAQTSIRTNYIKTNMAFYRLEGLKKYYELFATIVARFKYLDLAVFGLEGFYKNHYNEFDSEFITNLKLDNIGSRHWLKYNVFKTEMYSLLDKRLVRDPCPVELINKLTAFEARYLADGKIIEPAVLSVEEVRYLIIYFIQKSLLGLYDVIYIPKPDALKTAEDKKLEQQRIDFINSYVNYFLNNEFKPLEERNCMTEKQVSLYLRELLNIKNKKRKERHENLKKEGLDDTYNLYRQLKLGNLFGDIGYLEEDEETTYMNGDEALEQKLAKDKEKLMADMAAAEGVGGRAQGVYEDEVARQELEDAYEAEETQLGKGSNDVDDPRDDDFLD